MSSPPVPTAELARRKSAIEKALADGFAPPNFPPRTGRGSAVREAARWLKVSNGTLFDQLDRIAPDWSIFKAAETGAPIPPLPPAAPTIPEQSTRAEVTRLKDTIAALQTQLRDADREHLDDKAVRHRIMGLAAYEPKQPDWLIAPKKNPSGIAGVPSTIWSDWHIGEVVSRTETNGVNEFNYTIAERRIKALVNRTIDLCFNHMVGASYPGIVVNLLGDMVSGEIHPELAETNEEDLYPTIVWTLDRILCGLLSFADRFGRVHVAAVPGNHGRSFDKKPRAKHYVHRNADWLIYQLLERHFETTHDNRVTFDIPPSGDVLYRVYDHRYMGVHGDDLGVRGGDGIIGAIGPIMRGEIKIRHSSAEVGRDYDTLLMGHWHQDLILPRAIVNPTLKGYDEFARRMLRAVPNEPAQTLWFTHPRWGITAHWKIQLDEKPMSQGAEWVSLSKR